jgi:hypothetical protein
MYVKRRSIAAFRENMQCVADLTVVFDADSLLFSLAFQYK